MPISPEQLSAILLTCKILNLDSFVGDLVKDILKDAVKDVGIKPLVKVLGSLYRRSFKEHCR